MPRFPFLHFPLPPLHSIAAQRPRGPGSPTLKIHLDKARYSIRLLRYWWAGQALAREAQRRGRPLTVVDLGCERGWLQHFTPEDVVARWIGLDWNITTEIRNAARYDELLEANFDDTLPLPAATADAVVSLHVFEHLPRPGFTMAEVSRLLRPDGVFLGGAPTMPHLLAQWREAHFRKLWQQNRISSGGHITVLSPTRWKRLAGDVGLSIDFLTGSHAIRHTGSPLENHAWWIRLNQIWGGLFPALGSECYLQARKTVATTEKPAEFTPRDLHHRPAWITAAAAVVVAAGFFVLQWSAAQNSQIASTLGHWLDAHQTGADTFIATHPTLHLTQRSDTICLNDLSGLQARLKSHPGAHVLVTLEQLPTLFSQCAPDQWQIDSRLEIAETDYLLLKEVSSGTPVTEYLRGVGPALAKGPVRLGEG